MKALRIAALAALPLCLALSSAASAHSIRRVSARPSRTPIIESFSIDAVSTESLHFNAEIFPNGSPAWYAINVVAVSPPVYAEPELPPETPERGGVAEPERPIKADALSPPNLGPHDYMGGPILPFGESSPFVSVTMREWLRPGVGYEVVLTAENGSGVPVEVKRQFSML